MLPKSEAQQGLKPGLRLASCTDLGLIAIWGIFVTGIGGIIEGRTYTTPGKARLPAKVVPVYEKPEPIVFPKDLRVGTEAEWKALARLRRLDAHAVCLAACSGVLHFGTYRGISLRRPGLRQDPNHRQRTGNAGGEKAPCL